MAPSGSFYQVDVQCPFYKWDDGKRRITCEGLVENSSVALLYTRKQDFVCQIEGYCCKNYKYCEIYRAKMGQYEED